MILDQKTDILQSRRQEALRLARRDVDRRIALAAGSELFAQRGFEGATMADIAASAGISLKALYAVFASKIDLFQAVVDDGYERLVRPLVEVDRADLEPGERVLAVVDDLLSVMDANHAFVALYARGSAGVPDKLRSAGRDPYAPYIEALNGRIGEVIQESRGDLTAAEARRYAVVFTAAVFALGIDAIASRPAQSILSARRFVHEIVGAVVAP